MLSQKQHDGVGYVVNERLCLAYCIHKPVFNMQWFYYSSLNIMEVEFAFYNNT